MANSQSHINKPDYRILGKCPVCRALLQGSNTKLVERKGNNSLFHVDCSRCKSSILMMVLFSPLGIITTIGMLTDISKRDIRRLRARSSVDSDDVLAMHAFLKNKRI